MKLRQGGFRISKIHQLSGRIFGQKLKEYKVSEINPAQGRILFVLWQNDNIPIIELSMKTSLEKSTLTRMLDKLQESGLIKRVSLDNDRRKILIQLTEKNKKMKETYDQISMEMSNLFYKGFSDDDIDIFEKYLQKIFHNLLEYEKSI